MAVVHAGESECTTRPGPNEAGRASLFRLGDLARVRGRTTGRHDAALSSRRQLVTDPVLRLTPGQRDCLRLVYRHMTSKDIARTLGISPHTVDMRLRTAMRTLGVASRIDAARLLVDDDARQGDAQSYQPLIYQPPEIAAASMPAAMASPVSTTGESYAQPQHPRSYPDIDPDAGGPPRSADGLRYGEGRYTTSLAKSLPWGRRNRLTPGARLAWIAAIAIGSALGFGAILAALEALKHLL